MKDAGELLKAPPAVLPVAKQIDAYPCREPSCAAL